MCQLQWLEQLEGRLQCVRRLQKCRLRCISRELSLAETTQTIIHWSEALRTHRAVAPFARVKVVTLGA